MARREEQRFDVDAGCLLWGVAVGMVVGGVVALLTAPRSGRATRQQITESVQTTGQELRTRVEAIAPSDPVAESLAEGKAAARRRMEQLQQLPS